MTQEQFLYWLQGFVELNRGAPPDAEQWASIVEHLNLVFKKVTKPVSKPVVPVTPVPTDNKIDIQKRQEDDAVSDMLKKIWETMDKKSNPDELPVYPFFPPYVYPAVDPVFPFGRDTIIC